MQKRNIKHSVLFLIFTSLVFTGCMKDDETKLFSPLEQFKIDSAIIQNYITENELDAFNVEYNEQASGIYCAILEEGTVEPDKSPTIFSDVTVRYKGYLINGRVFDQTEEGDSATFNLGTAIVGWRIGFTALSRGDKATLLIPSFYGYGEVPTGSIPANSVLLFDVELLSIL